MCFVFGVHSRYNLLTKLNSESQIGHTTVLNIAQILVDSGPQQE